MIRRLALALTLAATLAGCIDSQAQTEQQSLVDRSTLAVQDLFAPDNSVQPRQLLHNAKGAMICPQIFKAGFFVGGMGGNCVLVGRLTGSFTAPAFYSIGSASLGLQFGAENSEVVFIVLTEKGLRALLDSQFKVGADASIAVATIGTGISGATTAALNADIVSFAKSSGLYAGVSFEGSLISAKRDWNEKYYGRPMAAQQIVLQREARAPGAAPLTETLARYAAPGK